MIRNILGKSIKSGNEETLNDSLCKVRLYPRLTRERHLACYRVQSNRFGRKHTPDKRMFSPCFAFHNSATMLINCFLDGDTSSHFRTAIFCDLSGWIFLLYSLVTHSSTPCSIIHPVIIYTSISCSLFSAMTVGRDLQDLLQREQLQIVHGAALLICHLFKAVFVFLLSFC